jgi:hypothetical protein
MAYPIRVRPQVEGEIVEAMAWYERRSPGLGRSFYRTHVGVLTLIAENPELYSKIRGRPAGRLPPLPLCSVLHLRG